MIILNYLISIGLIVTTVIKTSELFICSDKALDKLEEQFVQDTKKLLKDQKGSISLVAITLIAMISFLLLFYLTKMKLEYRESLYRSQSYLCAHYLNQETKKYINEMAKFNIAIRTAFLAQNTTVSGVSGLVIFKGLVHVRDIRHLLFVKKIIRNNYCHFPETLSYFQNLPFKTKNKLSLETNIDETTQLRTTEWTNYIYLNPKGIRIKKSFCLKSIFQVKNTFIPDTKHSSSELAMEDLSNLKCLYGSSS